MLVIDMQAPAAPLLDITEAADFLRVSETSLRRWTNAGRLPCVRIGGRQERRFRREDLEAFLSRGSGVPSLTAAPRHLCGFYTSDLTRARDAAALLAAAPRTAGRMFLVAKAAVRRAVLALLGREQLSRLVLAEYQRSAAAQVRYWREQIVQIVRECREEFPHHAQRIFRFRLARFHRLQDDRCTGGRGQILCWHWSYRYA